MKKFCNGCKIDKNIEDFGVNSKSKDGLKSRCRDCLRAENRVYAKSQREIPERRVLLNKRNKDYKKRSRIENPQLFKNQMSLHKKTFEIKHPGRISEQRKKYYNNNRDKEIKSGKEWAKNNPDKIKKYSKNTYIKNPNRFKLNANKRRAHKKNALTQKFSKDQLDQRMSVFGNKCIYCGGPFQQIDHLIPISKGGPHCLSNFRPSCRSCNNKKSNKNAKEWLAYIKGINDI